MERWEAVRPGGPEIVCDDEQFRPGTDSFLLSAFPRLKRGLRVCDLGCGTGLLGVLLLARETELEVTGVDLDPRAAELAGRCAARNGLGDRLRVLCADLRDLRPVLPASSFDLVISNPPYYLPGSGAAPAGEARRRQRTETSCTLEDVCCAGSYLLRWGGRIALVHKPERLTDLLEALRAVRCEPKRLRFAAVRPGAAPSLVLAEGVLGGRPGLTVEPDLFLEASDGTPTPEADAAYFRTKELDK